MNSLSLVRRKTTASLATAVQAGLVNERVVLFQEGIRLELIRGKIASATNPNSHFAVRRFDMGNQAGSVGLGQKTHTSFRYDP